MPSYKNYAETQVEHILKNVLKDYTNICTCDKCVSDMCAIALNSLKPKYVVSTTGKIYTCALNEIDKQQIVTITTEVIKAIEIVSSNTQHE
ncbi:MAG: late competence development ComFB family protein [Clostridium sp.]|uniref:late competence development ComFB family protein n=1 Tax=Clostridium sp. TaxID=1506 RepID=UPI00303F80D1